MRCIGQKVGYAVFNGHGYTVSSCLPEQCTSKTIKYAGVSNPIITYTSLLEHELKKKRKGSLFLHALRSLIFSLCHYLSMSSLILRSLSIFLVCLDHLCRLAILCLDQHAHILNHLESLLIISLDRLDILKEDLFEHENVVMNSTSAGMGYRHHRITSALAILVTGASQSRQHGKSESDSYYLSD
ncbi:hypothetical protein Tco_0861491 [Tanacetum coccineum]|uniref:Uncharacterized protein n=1 Tax=Tanacetum coccineum TaxID=301880 RepID=A0ABQ5BJL8_9ASTR